MAGSIDKIRARSAVDERGCWIWQRAISSTGYGAYRLNERQVSSHRASYIIAHGDIPDGLVVMHKCDVKLCCNPDHLELGTQKQNVRDMLSRGRWKHNGCRGERAGNAKLTAGVVMEIRQLFLDGVTNWHIAKRYSVAPATIRYIRIGKTWSHVRQSTETT